MLFNSSVTIILLKKPSRETLKLTVTIKLYNNQSIVMECLHIVWKTSLFYEMCRTAK